MFRLQVTIIRQTFSVHGHGMLVLQHGIPYYLHFVCRISDI